MGHKIPPAPLGHGATPISVEDGTSALTMSRTPGPTVGPDDVSIEIGACFVPVSTGIRGLNPAEGQVLAWLRANRAEIIDAEQTFRVDRRAIAGAIAWEMLENVAKQQRIWAGPGKLHLVDYDKHHLLASSVQIMYNFWVLGDLGKGTLAEEVEQRGYVPKLSYGARFSALQSTSGAIKYIAASMAAFAEIAERYTSEDLRNRPEILTNAYQSKTLTTWEAAVSKKPPGAPFVGGNPMDIWVSSHIAFLEDGVGKPNLPNRAYVPAIKLPKSTQ